MRFWTDDETAQMWAGSGQPPLDSGEAPKGSAPFPGKAYQFFAAASYIAGSLEFNGDRALLLTEWDIWPSSENWHLYYRLRQSYGDLRLLQEAPGHLFLPHESADMATFIQITMLSGLGGHVLCPRSDVRYFISHDEFVQIYADSSESAAPHIEALTRFAAKG